MDASDRVLVTQVGAEELQPIRFHFTWKARAFYTTTMSDEIAA